MSVPACRSGKLCIVILAAVVNNKRVAWLIDVCALGSAAFAPVPGHPGLKALLEDTSVEKLMWDPRLDSDALYAQYNVHLKNVMCVQLAEARNTHTHTHTHTCIHTHTLAYTLAYTRAGVHRYTHRLAHTCPPSA